VAATEGGFDIFLTGDRTLIYEQNLVDRRLGIVVLSANNWPIIKEYIPGSSMQSVPPSQDQFWQ
jgi:hypothetical protein